MKSNVVESYAYGNLGRTDIMETKQLGSQCVALTKDFSEKVLGRKLGSFGGSAKSGWQNYKNTFPEEEFLKIENNGENKALPGDLIFWTNGQYGHTGIVMTHEDDIFKVVNQNVGNGDGRGDDDGVIITEYKNDRTIAGWYRYKKFIAEYEGIPVFIKEQPENAETRNGAYIPKKYGGPYIILYPFFFEKTQEKQLAILEHEYSHYVYFDILDERTRELWEEMSYLTPIVKTKLFLRSFTLYENGYLNSHAEKSPSEDFAECWEYYIENGTTDHKDKYIKLKIETVVAAMKKHDPRTGL